MSVGGWVGGAQEVPSAIFSPLQLPGLLHWSAADKLTGLSNDDPVVTLTDFSGLAKHGTQGTASKRGLYKTNIVNGRPAVLLDGVDDFYSFAGITTDPAASGYCILIAFRATAADEEDIISQESGAGTGRGLLFISAPASPVLKSGLGNTTLGTAVYTADAWAVAAANWDLITQSLFLNGAAGGTNTPTAEAANGAWILGIWRDLASAPFAGYIGELIVCGPLTTAQRRAAESYLGSRWGVVVS